MPVATNRGMEVTGFVRAEGDLDFRGTLGVERTAPVGFRSIRLIFDLDTTASQERPQHADRHHGAVLRRIYQTLASSPELEVHLSTMK